MKILHITTHLKFGGAEKLIHDIIPIMQNYGHEVDLLLFDGQQTPFKTELEQKGIRVIDLHIINYYNPFNFIKLLPYFKSYDIIHTHTTPAQIAGALAKLFHSTKLCTTEHSTSNRRRGNKLFRHIDKFAYNRYDKVICISDAAKNNLTKWLKVSEKIADFV